MSIIVDLHLSGPVTVEHSLQQAGRVNPRGVLKIHHGTETLNLYIYTSAQAKSIWMALATIHGHLLRVEDDAVTAHVTQQQAEAAAVLDEWWSLPNALTAEQDDAAAEIKWDG